MFGRFICEHTSSNIHEGWSVSFLAFQCGLCTEKVVIYFRYFFSIVGPTVKIYAYATGDVVSTLSVQHPNRSVSRIHDSDAITAACLNPHNAFQLITSSFDGRIMVWDFLDATVLQVIELGQPVTHMCAHEQFPNFVFVGAMRPESNENPNGM
jgi:NET1-associated nuclear protein 1 (U3 small nucleolar RNA-associated protein 17)